MNPSGTRLARHFSLLDAMGLIAALGVGLALSRGYLRCASVLDSLLRSEPNNVRELGPRQWAYACLPSLVALTLVLWPLRFVPPRPRFRRCIRLPGLMPSYAVMLALAVALAEAALEQSTLSRTHFPFVGVLDLGEILSLRVVAAKEMIGPAVAVTWLILWLGGGWRSERTWIDRAGRLLGFTWIFIGIVNWVGKMSSL